LTPILHSVSPPEIEVVKSPHTVFFNVQGKLTGCSSLLLLLLLL
jgi:hypothetical protein